MSAPIVLGRVMNRVASEALVEQVVIPNLAPGDILIIDESASTRQTACLRRSKVPDAGCSIFRPTVQLQFPREGLR